MGQHSTFCQQKTKIFTRSRKMVIVKIAEICFGMRKKNMFTRFGRRKWMRKTGFLSGWVMKKRTSVQIFFTTRRMLRIRARNKQKINNKRSRKNEQYPQLSLVFVLEFSSPFFSTNKKHSYNMYPLLKNCFRDAYRTSLFDINSCS